jgi:hypothetical protein
MLRGSVAMSRALPEMATPLASEADGLPPLAMAEDQDPDEAAADRVAEPPVAYPDEA